MESGNLNLEVYIKNFTFLKRALRILKCNIFKKKSKDSSYWEADSFLFKLGDNSW